MGYFKTKSLIVNIYLDLMPVRENQVFWDKTHFEKASSCKYFTLFAVLKP